MNTKLYTVGPTEMFESSLQVGSQQVPYFRNQTFSDVMLDCASHMKRFAGAKQEDKFIVLTASGTGAMEAAVINSLNQQDKALVIAGGSFGKRFSQICSIHNIDHTDITLQDNETLTEKHLAPYKDCGYTALLVNLDETSTGQLYDRKMLAQFCENNNLLFIVDAVSAFATDPIEMSELGIGVLITSSQKALSLAPGLSFVWIQHDVYQTRVIENQDKTLYFDFVDYVNNAHRGQTPFTPAVGIVMQLQDICHKIDADGGIQAWIDRTAALAQDFRSRIATLPISIPPYPLANGLTPIIFDNADAEEVNQRLLDEYAIQLNPCGGDKAHTMSRVAHMGNHTIEDNIYLCNALQAILEQGR